MGDGIGDLSQLLLVLSQPGFSPLEVVDIGIRSVPLEDVALLVAHGLDADDEPTILAVMATQSYFGLAGFRRRKNLGPLGHRAWGLVGMNNDLGDVAPVLHRETRVLLPALIDIGDGAIRAKAPRLCRDRVEDRSKSTFRGLKFEECVLESRL